MRDGPLLVQALQARGWAFLDATRLGRLPTVYRLERDGLTATVAHERLVRLSDGRVVRQPAHERGVAFARGWARSLAYEVDLLIYGPRLTRE